METKHADHKKHCDEITALLDRDKLLEALWLTFKTTQGSDTKILRQSILDRLAQIDDVDWMIPTA